MKSEKGENYEIKLHFGCGNNYLDGWINIDNNADNSIKKLDLNWDFNRPLPFKNSCADVVYDANFSDRLKLGTAFIESLLSCFRHLLKEEGILKIGLSDVGYKTRLDLWLKKLGFPNVEFYTHDWIAKDEEVITDDIVVIDDSFPQASPHAFRNMEINGLMDKLDNFCSYTLRQVQQRPQAWYPWQFGVSEYMFNKNKEGYLKYYPQNEKKLKYLYPNKKYKFKLVYSYFMLATHTLLPFYEINEIPFVFVLYPGGTFALNNKGSDLMLKEIFASKYFRKVIVTQKVTLDYLLNNNLCQPDKIEYLFGGYVQFKKGEALPKKFYSKDKSTFDICFVAAKYGFNSRYEKGYDLFVETAKQIARKYPYVRFHVVGGFDEKDIDITDIKEKITFYGYKRPDFLKEFYSGMDICLSPNIPSVDFKGKFDGFPLGADALCCQTALFTTDELNNNDGYFNENEIVIIKPELEDIVKKIEFYLNNLDLLYNLSKNGQKKLYKIMDPVDRVKKVKKILLDASNIKNMESKPVLDRIEFHVTEHCNLNCKGCGHYCPIAEPEFVSLKNIKKDLKRLSELFSTIGNINILGGEPLLHKDINEIIKITRGFFPSSTINLITNGILIPKMTETFWQALNKFSIRLALSLYPPFESLQENVYQLTKKYGVYLELRKVTEFFKGLDLSGCNNKTETFNGCGYKICHFIKDGTISVCGLPHHIRHFNKKFNRTVPQDGVINIHDPEITGEKINEFLNTPTETCKYCKPAVNSFAWAISEGKESDWCIDDVSPESNESKIKLHFGSDNNYLDDWINIDNNYDNDILKLDLDWDFKKHLPFKENCADIIYDEKFLERLKEGPSLIESLLSCYRYLLKPESIFKIALPDMKYQSRLEPWLKKLGFSNLEFCFNEKAYKIIENNSNITSVSTLDINNLIKKQNDGKIKLNLGCGTNYFDGWINIDNNSDNNIAKLDLNFDLRNPLPFEENSVDFIYNEHFLEHLTVEEGLKALRDFKRVLKPGGVLRIAMPDLADMVKTYNNKNWKIDNAESFYKWGLNFLQTRAEYLNVNFKCWGHKWLYDKEELERRLKEAGFLNIEFCELRKSKFNELKHLETRDESTLIAEVTKKSRIMTDMADKEPILTILLVTYNHKDYIRKALDSILMQETNFSFKVIIADDCSTDGTTEICKEYADKYPKIIEFIPKIKNIGMINNVYEGYKKIDTPYLAFLDGDDYWIDENKLQMQIDLLEENPDCVICGHNTIIHNVNEIFDLSKARTFVQQNSKNNHVKFSLDNYTYLHTSSRIYRNIFVDLSEHTELIPDVPFYQIMLDIGKCIYIDKIMSVYCVGKLNSAYASLLKHEQDIAVNDVVFNMLNFFKFRHEEYYTTCMINAELYKYLTAKAGKERGLKLYHYLVNKALKRVGKSRESGNEPKNPETRNKPCKSKKLMEVNNGK